MSKIKVSFDNKRLRIETEVNNEYIELDTLEYGKEYLSKIEVSNSENKNKLFLFHKLESKDVIDINEEDIDTDTTLEESKTNVVIVYSDDNNIRYAYCSLVKGYKKILKLRYKVINISLSKKYLKFKILAYISNPYKLDIEDVKFYADKELYKECNLKVYENEISKIRMLKENNIYTFKFNIQDIINDESIINGPVRFSLKLKGEQDEIDYKVGKINKKIKSSKYYGIPMKAIYVKDFAIHIRRTISGNLVLVKRKIDIVEKSLKFKIMESELVSLFMYTIGKILTKIRRKKVNLFYEKFASKSEEGVYDLCIMSNKSYKARNYFVIDENSKDYNNIKQDKYVVKKYSFKFYWLFYNTSYFIASEVPSHLNVLRSNNKYFRKAINDKKFIFLQHGIIYMKNLGINSVFMKGKEGESEYMVVSSEKEKKVVAEMLNYEEQQLLNTGLAMYSKIKYNHINNNSKDIITIMLTWKPYEEQLYNFKKSSYYKNVTKIYNMLTKYVKKKNIIIIPHPKVQELLYNNSKEKCNWKENICKNSIAQALEKTKVLITDYSSVCYNAFYQGAGVIFYQEDIEKYECENGKLIPDNSEYVGERVFSIKELDKLIKNSIEGKRIDLAKLRTEKHEENYKTINEHTDGKNLERIYKELTKLEIV